MEENQPNSSLPKLPNLEQLKLEIQSLTETVKTNLGNVKHLALSEAWKILQLVSSEMIMIIEKHTGEDLSGPDKKKLAMNLIEKFYDTILIHVDIPFIPSVLEGLLHKHVKKILLVLVSSSIDVFVSTFNKIGFFKKPQLVSVTPQ